MKDLIQVLRHFSWAVCAKVVACLTVALLAVMLLSRYVEITVLMVAMVVIAVACHAIILLTAKRLKKLSFAFSVAELSSSTASCCAAILIMRTVEGALVSALLAGVMMALMIQSLVFLYITDRSEFTTAKYALHMFLITSLFAVLFYFVRVMPSMV